VPCITTMSGASAAQRAIRASRSGETEVISLQELHGKTPHRAHSAEPSASGLSRTLRS
jgi:hypothetical protein